MDAGYVAVLNYKVDGIAAGGAWVELDNCKDLKTGLSSSEHDVTTRRQKGWKATEPVQKAVEITFDMICDENDAGFNAIRTAWLTDGVLGIQALSRPLEDGGQGPQFDGKVFSFERNEPTDGPQTVSVKLMPCYSETPPSWLGD